MDYPVHVFEREHDATKGGSLSLIPSKEIERTGNTEANEAAGVSPALEDELVQVFVSIARSVGYSRSVGEIYAALFISRGPMNSEQIARNRGISAGSVSSGLRELREIGAVQVSTQPGDRRDHYSVSTDFRQITLRLVRTRFEPRLMHGARKIAELGVLAVEAEGPRRDPLRERVVRFVDWQKRVMALMQPILALADMEEKEGR